MKTIIKHILTYLHKHDKEKPNIYIFSLPRSGSTLLTEILNTDVKSKVASEIFSFEKSNLFVLKEYFESNYLKERYVDLSEKELHLVFKYLDDISDGKTINSFYWSDLFTKNHSYFTSRTIFKIHKLTYHYKDVVNYFVNDYGIYLLRNPISHSLSRIKQNWSTYIDLYSNSKNIAPFLSNDAKLIIRKIHNSENILLKFVVSWCLENYTFIQDFQNKCLPPNISPVFYEDLLLNPSNTIGEICQNTKMNYNQGMLSVIDKPSKGIIHSTKITKEMILKKDTDYLVNRWKKKVNKSTVNQIITILKSFNINLYLNDLKISDSLN